MNFSLFSWRRDTYAIVAPCVAFALVGCRTEPNDEISALRDQILAFESSLLDVSAEMAEADSSQEADLAVLSEDLLALTEGVDLSELLASVAGNASSGEGNDARIGEIEQSGYANEGWVGELGFASGEETVANADAALQNGQSISANGDTIATNGTDIAQNSVDINSGVAVVGGNSALLSLAQALISNMSSVVQDNLAAINTNSAAVSSNSSDIATSVQTILSNTSSATANSDAVTVNESDIAINGTAISPNATGAAQNTVVISANAASIATNTSLIAVNTLSAAGNTADLASNTATILAASASIDDYQEFYTASVSNTEGEYKVTDYTGTYTLDASTASGGDILYGANGMLVLDLTNTYPRLLVNIDNANSLVCSMFANENDTPTEQWVATDSGSNYSSRWQAAGYTTCSGESCPNTFVVEDHSGGDYAIGNWAAYYILCLE